MEYQDLNIQFYSLIISYTIYNIYYFKIELLVFVGGWLLWWWWRSSLLVAARSVIAVLSTQVTTGPTQTHNHGLLHCSNPSHRHRTTPSQGRLSWVELGNTIQSYVPHIYLLIFNLSSSIVSHSYMYSNPYTYIVCELCCSVLDR